MEYPTALPAYLVKRSTLQCDNRPDGGFNAFPWNVWKVAKAGQNWRCIGAYRTEAEGQAAAEADRAKGPHF